MRVPIASLLLAPAVRAVCFGTDGRNASNVWQPCPVTGTKMCCAFGNGDTCTPDGLCLNNGRYWRDGCTDQGWGAGCLNVCLCKRFLDRGMGVVANAQV